jgi:hypothetical protein
MTFEKEHVTRKQEQIRRWVAERGGQSVTIAASERKGEEAAGPARPPQQLTD